MLVPISEITVSPGRREAEPETVRELADSIAQVGLLNPITIDRTRTLIAGLHRLEAAKLLNWTEIECTESSLEGLQAELAEIDENVVRKGLSAVEFGNLLLRRKEIYELLHPESVQTNLGGPFRGNQHEVVSDKMTLTTKSFAQDTAEKLGVGRRTVERQIQTAKNLTPEAKDILQRTATKMTKMDALKLSRLAPEQQKEAASQLAAGAIKKMAEYQPAPEERAGTEAQENTAPPNVPYSLGEKRYASLEESIADLKNPNKDCSYTPDTLLADIDGFVQRFHKDFAWYNADVCTVVFPAISQAQFEYVQERFGTIPSVIEDLINHIQRSIEA